MRFAKNLDFDIYFDIRNKWPKLDHHVLKMNFYRNYRLYKGI